MLGLPLPVIAAPERARLIASGGHEFQVLPVRDLVPVDLERRHVGRVHFVLVVPTEYFVATPQS